MKEQLLNEINVVEKELKEANERKCKCAEIISRGGECHCGRESSIIKANNKLQLLVKKSLKL